MKPITNIKLTATVTPREWMLVRQLKAETKLEDMTKLIMEGFYALRYCLDHPADVIKAVEKAVEEAANEEEVDEEANP